LMVTVEDGAFPSFAKAELSKLRFAETLEGRRVAGRKGFDLGRVSFLTTVLWDWLYPSFAKEGWTRPKENAAKHPLKGADGVVL